MPLSDIRADSCIVRGTGTKRGRTRWVEPGRTAMRELHYGRIILDGGDAPLAIDPGSFETGLICLKGVATVTVAGESWAMRPYDALYVPRMTRFTVTPGAQGVDFAELAAIVEGHYPVQFVRFADVRSDPGLHFAAGGPTTERDLNILIGKNVEAGRILAGVTFSKAGNWTSWPPHEHGVMLEEAYLYIAMPAPAFGVQLVYQDKQDPELATIVREDDVVLMPQGYHPNVAAPGGRIGFLWFMAAHREVADRQFGVVNVQPEFAQKGSGLEAARK